MPIRPLAWGVNQPCNSMNKISQLIPETNLLLNLEASSKKRLFEQTGLMFENHHGLASSKVFESLFARERLGSTGLGAGVFRVTDLVEKPRRDEAPSNLAIIGRYVLTPDIFHSLSATVSDRTGEIQLTNGLRHLLASRPIYACEISGVRHDTGNKLGFLKALVYFASWIALAWTLTRWSRRQDEGDMSGNMLLQRVSGAGLVIYALTITLAGVDWVMSINPHFYSTIWGFLFLGSQGLSALAFTILVARFLSQREPMSGVLKAHHFHDLGKFSLAFVMLWAYFNFSQYLLVYSANLVEEVPYFITRISNGWQYLALFLFLFQFAVPFSLLLSRDLKRSSNRLVMVAAWIIFMRFLDMFMLVSPEFSPQGANLHIGSAEHVSAFFISVSAILAIAVLLVVVGLARRVPAAVMAAPGEAFGERQQALAEAVTPVGLVLARDEQEPHRLFALQKRGL